MANLFLVSCITVVFLKTTIACIEGCFCKNSPAVIDCLDRGLHELKIDNSTLGKQVYHIFAAYNYLRQINYTNLLEHYPNLNILDVRGNDNFNCSTVPPRRLKVVAVCERTDQPPFVTINGEGLEYRATDSTKTALQVAAANLIVIAVVGGTYLVSVLLRRRRLVQATTQTYSVQTAF